MQEICYSCCSDLSSEPKVTVIIKKKNDEYSCLYSVVVDLLNNEKLEMQPDKINQKIDKLFCKFFCFSLRVNPNSLAISLILKTTFAVDISPRFNLIIFVFHTTLNCIPTLEPHSLLGTTRVTRPTLAC